VLRPTPAVDIDRTLALIASPVSPQFPEDERIQRTPVCHLRTRVQRLGVR